MKRKIVSLFLIITLIFTICYIPLSLAEENQTTYTVKQITSEDEIKSDSANDYIIVFEDQDGTNYALASRANPDTKYYAMDKNNSEVVNIEGNTIKYSGNDNILWTFTKSTITVSEEDDKPALEASIPVYSGDISNRDQLEFVTTNTSRNPAGIEYTQNSYGFIFHFDDDGTVEMEQDNGNAKYCYLRFLSTDKRFLSSKHGNAASLKIYEVIKTYKDKSNFDISSIPSIPDYPNQGAIKIDKIANTSDNYENNGKANVKLSAMAEPINRDLDIVLIIDDSNSVNQSEAEGEKTRAEVIKQETSRFAEEILKINPNNRIGIVRFAGDVIYKDESDNLGLSNNIDEIKKVISKERDESEGGTNYTAAFEQANRLFEMSSVEENRDSIAVFVSDGGPSIYNRIKYTVYKNTTDGEIGHHADNWVNYLINSELKENVLMKESGVKIYTIGAGNYTKPITSNGSFVINSEDTIEILQNLATEESYFYDWNDIIPELGKIYEKILRDFYIYPKDAVVTDILGDDVVLLTKKIEDENQKIVIKHGEEIIEEITFNEDGTEAYSNLNEEENILTKDENKKMIIETENLKYTESDKTFTWKIGELDKQEWSLEYPVYLTRTVNMYNDGTDREEGKYDTNKEAYITYTNHLDEEITQEFPIPGITWKIEDNTQAPGKLPQAGQTIVVIAIILTIAIIAVIIKIRSKKSDF